MATAGPERSLFDIWSLFYDLPLVQRAVYRAPHDAVIDELRRNACESVLDVGCGTGILAARLRRELPGARVVGCDFSRGMLGHARARTRRTAWVCGDACRLPFRAGSFDAVVSTEAFHWFPDQRAALAEFRRLLRPGGLLLLALVNPRLAVTGRFLALASRVLGEPFVWRTRSEMRRMIAAAGFRVESQHTLFRVPAGLLFPPVLTVAIRTPARDQRTGAATSRRDQRSWRVSR
jgi:ubiquinone/menaquinone biosynthesis C-methylase UbiE